MLGKWERKKDVIRFVLLAIDEFMEWLVIERR